LSRAPRELDLINAVPAVARPAGQQLDALVKAILELPDEDPSSIAALRLWAAALPRLTECDIAIVAASLQLADWWNQNTPDPTLVFGRPVADQLRGAVQELDRDQLEHDYSYCQELAATATARVAQLADDQDPEQGWEAIAESTHAEKAAFGGVLGAAKSFTQYIHDCAFDQHVEILGAAARTTARNTEVCIASQVVMPDGGGVTTDDRVIPPPPSRRRRRRWPRRNRSRR
jgi:hypothetical protein